MDNDHISFLVIKDMSTLKYAYEDTIKGAIASIAHQNKLTLTEEDKEYIMGKVSEALKILWGDSE